MLCCSKEDRGILIGRFLQVNRYLHIGPPISTAPRVASTFAGRGAAPTFDFCLSTSIPVLTTSTYVVAWPQGDQLLGGGPSVCYIALGGAIALRRESLKIQHARALSS